MKAQKLGLGARAFGGLAGGDWDLAGRSSHYQSVFDFFNPFFNTHARAIPIHSIQWNYFPTSRLGVLSTSCLIALLWPQTACNKIIANDPSSRSGKAKSGLPKGRLNSPQSHQLA